MSLITGGVPLAGFVSPTDSTDTYPVIDPIYGIDGWRSVADTTARDAIPTARRRELMIVCCQSDKIAYQLKGGTDNSKWVDLSTQGTNGNTILNGSGVPSGGSGVSGDFYLDTANELMYGPKTSVWPSGVTLMAPTKGSITGDFEAPLNKTYTLDLYAPSYYTVDSITIKTTSGTCTANLQINNTSVRGASAISVSSGVQTIVLSTANLVTPGASLNLIVTNVSSTVDLQFSIGTTRNSGRDSIGQFMEAPTNKTYVLDLSATYTYTIDSLVIKTGSGTLTAAIQINGVNVTSLSAVSVTSGVQTVNATGANTVAIGNSVTLVVTAISLPTDLQMSLLIH